MRTTTTMPDVMSTADETPPVDVETWLLRCDARGWRSAPPIVTPLVGNVHPHDVAHRAASSRRITADVVHSTSWRMVAGRLVVTYIVVTQTDLGTGSFDVHPDRTHEFRGTTQDHTSGSLDPICPPDNVADWEVVHHALHHLALLATTNKSIAAALSLTARQSLRPLVPAGAGILTTTTLVS
jgi:hypothetical protein